ncbi:MAG: hypothetical protein A0129_09460 [Limnobacter sp. CACIAM 66H1]|jgi:hypothetical protein|uniref:DUF2784 domain-containing protein n=1 Tax=unclassified Limnobacter TaxID=2630203 RepID=UPI0007A91D35|nr:DUF2784 domain-containing protein [Limnobacter sp. CACIAM 66H1]KYP11073.1 MAG: hypothetical protein A0129_09460 [Limnobacter sp. CACIAM 66H1]
MNYSHVADFVLLIHFAIVLFVVGGLLLIVFGNLLRWPWVNHWWFRVLHLLAISVVVFESWLGIECPLTTLENWLRLQAGQGVYQGSFIQHWVHGVMFYEAPGWVFALAYTLFALVVVAAWWRWPPQQFK